MRILEILIGSVGVFSELGETAMDGKQERMIKCLRQLSKEGDEIFNVVEC